MCSALQRNPCPEAILNSTAKWIIHFHSLPAGCDARFPNSTEMYLSIVSWEDGVPQWCDQRAEDEMFWSSSIARLSLSSFWPGQSHLFV